MTHPPVSVLIVTYQRAEILRRTLGGLFQGLTYAGPIEYVIADDGSTDETHAMLGTLVEAGLSARVVVSNRTGLGANTNAGLRVAFERSDLVLQLQDDMLLLQPLDLTAHVDWLLSHEQDGFIRLWGVGGHRYTATLDDRYWRISWDSDELYIPSDRPHLKTRAFAEAAGYYPEGLPTAATEEAYCHQVKNAARSRGVPAVLVPHSTETERNWEHLGWHSRWRDQGL